MIKILSIIWDIFVVLFAIHFLFVNNWLDSLGIINGTYMVAMTYIVTVILVLAPWSLSESFNDFNF